MFPELLRLPAGLTLRSYDVLVLAGIVSGMALLLAQGRRRGWNRSSLLEISVFTVFGGLVGARVFFYTQFYASEFAERPWWALFLVWEGGLVLYGALIGGFLVVVTLLRLYRIPTVPFLDAIAPAVALGVGLGRIGCFLNGCCWGRACSVEHPAAVRFPAGSIPATYALLSGSDPRNHWVHPTQLYESGVALAVALGLSFLGRRTSIPGVVGASFLICYGAARFGLEQLRGDHGSLSWPVSQRISAIVLPVGVAWLAAACWRARGTAPAEIR